MELWIIEAPGKVEYLTQILKSMGKDVIVRSTKGHIMSMPDLSNLGIDKNFREYERKPKFDYIIDNIRRASEKCDHLVVATDADEEGDAIAWDVFELLNDKFDSALRVRLKGMDKESVQESINEAVLVNKEDAIPGRTRAIIDRMIGATFSGEISVGRVKTALLGLVEKEKPTIYKIRLVCPAKDGGRPWFADCNVSPPLTKQIADDLVRLALPPLEFQSSSTIINKPNNMGQIMLKASEYMSTPIVESNKAMQKMYEIGKMTYPRSGSNGISRSMARKLAKVLKDNGYDLDAEKIPEKNEKEVHDSPMPIGKVNLGSDPRKCGDEEGIRIMVARDLVKTGQTHKEEKPNTSVLERFLATRGFPPEVIKIIGGLHWRREDGPSYPGQEKHPQNKMIVRERDAVLLEVCMKHNLGKPSTWANHIESFLKAGLMDDNMELNAKGKKWIEKSPPDLLNAKIAVAIEKACSRTDIASITPKGREPWEFLAEKIVEKLPEGLKNPLQNSIKNTSEHAVVNIKSFIKEKSENKTNVNNNQKSVFDNIEDEENSYGYRMEVD